MFRELLIHSYCSLFLSVALINTFDRSIAGFELWEWICLVLIGNLWHFQGIWRGNMYKTNMGALEIFDYSTASTGSNPKGDEVRRPRLSEDDTICIDATEPTELRRSPDNFCKHNIELSFSLVPSCYATSCIRELMKNWNKGQKQITSWIVMHDCLL